MRHSHFDDIVKQSKMIPGPGSYDPVYERYSSSSFRYLRGGNPMIYRSWRNIFHD